MKKIFYCLWILMIGLSCVRQGNNSYHIEGEIVGVQSGKVYLQKAISGSLRNIRCCELKNGHFSFSGRQKIPEVCYVSLDGKVCVAQFFLENSSIKIKSYPDNIDQQEIEGSLSNDLFLSFKDGIRGQEARVNKLEQEINILSMTGQLNKVRLKMKELDDANVLLKDYIVHFVQIHSESAVAPYVILWKLLPFVEATDLEKLTNQLSPKLKGSSYVFQLNQLIQEQKNLAIGRSAPNFILRDQNNQKRRLCDYRGKSVLLFFWASWDSAGKSLLVQLHALYLRYHSQKFEVITVAVDHSRDDWISFLTKNPEPWVSVFDVNGKGGSVAKVYQIKDIPYNYLIGPDGKIKKKNVELNALPALLSLE